MKAISRLTGNPASRITRMVLRLLPVLMASVLYGPSPAGADVTVSATGPGGSLSQTVPGTGGPFNLNLPLTRNAVNTITVTATDIAGNKVSQDLKVTQLSLDQIVVSQVTAEALSVQQIKQLVADGVIQLDNPDNYNVSKFDIVLTIGDKLVPVSVPVVSRINSVEAAFEPVPGGGGGGGGGAPPAPPPDMVVFDLPVGGGGGGGGIPPHISGVIIIEGNIKSLKEFYTVRLLLMNTSGIFTLKNVTANLAFPDGGLSSIAPADGVISFGDILPGDGGLPGQAERQFIIRGDAIGINRVQVNFGGTVGGPLIPDDQQIPFNGSALTKVEVKGPPTFKVVVTHPDSVTANVPYQLTVNITDTGDIAALYSSLSLDVGGAAQLVNCDAAMQNCTPIIGSDLRSFGDILPGQSVSATFTINPLDSGPISSCVGISDQNIALQVLVGNIGCLVGQIAPERGVPDGVPIVQVAPAPNLQGVSVQSAVTAFFSQEMNPGTITTGPGGTFNVFDGANNLVVGKIQFVDLNSKTVAVWQAWDTTFGVWAPLASNTNYTVLVTQGASNLNGTAIYSAWTSHFTTTGTGADDSTPPSLTLGVEPPVNPSYVLPGQLVKIDAYAADQGSGVARVELRSKDLTAGDAAYQFIDRRVVFKGDKPPFFFTIDSGKLTPGHTYQFLATAFDLMANSQDATLNLIVASSAAAPTITLPSPPVQGIAQGISVLLTPDSLTGGVTGVSYYLDGSAAPFKAVTLPPYQAGLGTLTLSLGDHAITAVAVDALGQTGTATYAFTVVNNPNKPQISLSGAVSGATYIIGSSFVLSGSATDPVGIASLNYYLDSTGGSPIATGDQPFSVATAGLATGVHQIIARAVNLLGASNTVATSFNVAEVPHGPAPAPPVIGTVSLPAGGVVTVTGSAAAGARIDVTNSTKMLTISVNADGSGNFSASLPGAGGDLLSLIDYDFTSSQLPSAAATRNVPVAPALTSIAAAPTSLSFTAANAWQDLAVTGSYDNGSNATITGQCSFSSDNPSVASVNAAGRVAAIASGSATITVSSSGKTTTVAVAVNIVTLTAISLAPAAFNSVYLGDSRQLVVTAGYSDGSHAVLNSGVTFTTADTTVANVTSGGLVTTVGNGSTQITAYYPGVQPCVLPVTVNTALDTPPAVQIVSPASGVQYQRGDGVLVVVRATDAIGGVEKIVLTVTGPGGVIFTDTHPVQPASLDFSTAFAFTVPDTLAIGSSFTISADAVDTGKNPAPTASITQSVVDTTAPLVAITAPAPQAPYNYGDTITLTVHATDRVGVSRIRYQTSGAFVSTGTKDIVPNSTSGDAAFSIAVPFGTNGPALGIVAYAQDASGNEGTSAQLSVIITNADITPPATRVSAVANPGGNPATTLTYQVTDGLADLDHVEIFFRRNGLGTFNRYFDADHGYPDGRYLPQSGDTGTLTFDSTKMGGDGSYEFYSIGVDKAGNRELAPSVLHAVAAYYPLAGSTKDYSNNSNNATVINGAAPAPDRFGNSGGAYSFNGSNQYVVATDSASLDLSNQFTLAAWINPAAGMQDPQQGGIISKVGGGGGNNGYQLAITNNNQTILCLFNSPGETWGTTSLAAAAPVPVGQWSHLACTYDGDSIRIYLNGTQVTSKPVGAKSIINSASNLRISGDDNGNVWFNGSIAEALVAGKALSAQEIAQIQVDGTEMVVADKKAAFSAGTNWTVIASAASAGEGDATYDNQNIRVTGTTFTVNGQHSFKNLELVSGAVLTHSAASDTATHHLDLNLWTLTVDGSSMIDLNGRGYRGGRSSVTNDPGLTSGNVAGSQAGTGGSHGGLGSLYDVGFAPAPVYDDFTNPTDLGGGGGTWSGYAGGAGGGVLLLQAINVVNDNSIRANGAQSAGSAAGDGAGGSINITSSSLSGKGKIQANGGTGVGTGGGGGRIAVNYLDLSALNETGIAADGGQGQYGIRASNGTIFLKLQTQGSGELLVDGQSGSTTYTTLVIPDGYTFNNITLRNSARVVTDSPIRVSGRLLLTGNSLLTHSQGSLNGLNIDAAVVQVDAGSAIDASGRGYRGGIAAGTDPGLTLGSLPGSQTGSGGSYGGKGAGYQGVDSGLVYGDPRNPVNLGSGGGTWAGYGSGAGGGLVTIHASNALVVDGAIRADGGSSSGSASGNGSGGSVLIRTSRLAGSGTISANGGGSLGVGGLGVGGGGGRVAVYCDYLDSAAPLGNLRSLSAFAGHGQYDTRQASAGTVYVKYNQGQEELFIDDNNAGASAAMNTPLTPIGSGSSGPVTEQTLKTDGQMAILSGGLTGLRLNPDLGQQESFAITGNSADTITVATPNEHGIAFSALAAPGKTYGGFYRYDNLTLRRGGNLLLADRLEVPGTLSITEHGLLSHFAATDHFTSGLYLNLGTLSIDSTGRIDVSGRGYRGGDPNVANDPGKTAGNVAGSTPGAGGSHGGLGSVYSGVPNPPYDSIANPTELGSGGGIWSGSAGGAGGGRVVINAISIALDGVIVANGAVSAGSAAGDGSGGTINISTGSLTGGGSLQANGGGNGIGTGGGGGRIAVVHSGAFSLLPELITVLGGQGMFGTRGGIGTVFIKDAAQSNGALIIDGGNFDVPSDSCTIPSAQTFDSMVLRNHARATVNGALNVSGQLLLTGNSVLTHSAGHEEGLSIDAGDVRIDAGSAIDATGRGYSGALVDYGVTLGGIPGSQRGTGGSYGGKGGGYQGNDSGLVYGDPRNPVFLGSGGGYWSGAGGAGGGRITIHASSSLVVEGSIMANGAFSSGSASGDGSGGSILIRCSSLAGTGTIGADGARNSSGANGSHVSGGGGRVAIYCDTLDLNDNFNNLRSVTAFSGKDTFDDASSSAGTVYFKYNQGAEYLYLDANLTGATATGATPLPHIGSGATAAVTADSLTLDGNVTLLPGGLAGLRLNPDTTQQESFAIKGNSATTISVVTPNENGANFQGLAAAGSTYSGVHSYQNLTFRRGANLLLGDPLLITGTLTLAENGLMSHFASTGTFTSGLTLTVGNFIIDSTGRIDVTGRGYLAGRTEGNAQGAPASTGGSHGGLGGRWTAGGAGNPAPVYDSETNPVDLGGGGGSYSGNAGGSGGGRVLINAGVLALDGTIRADGAMAGSSATGNGAGGSINISATALTGQGSVSANGGSTSGFGVGGGGGRIAIKYGGLLGLAGISASGGQGYYGSGFNGTVHLEQH
jgi:hypothetical protein